MNTIRKAFALCALAGIVSTGVGYAQDHHDDRDRNRDHDNHHYVHHDEWKKGYHMRHEDWDRGERVDYRQYHLHRPPHGYEWRVVDGNYVLAAVATGVIASVVIAGAR